MIVKGNPLLTGASGKIRDLVVKQYKDKTVITAVPDMSRRKLTEKQQQYNVRMKMAIICAKGMVADPVLKQRACDILGTSPNKVFRAIVKQFLLTDGEGGVFELSQQEREDRKTLAALTAAITTELPEAELMLFGNRAKGPGDAHSDWDFLILTATDHPQTLKWELQEKLFRITIEQGTRVNILLVSKTRWFSAPEYDVLRKRIEGELKPVKELARGY